MSQKLKKPQPEPKEPNQTEQTKKSHPARQKGRLTNAEPNERVSQTSWNGSAFYASVFMKISLP